MEQGPGLAEEVRFECEGQLTYPDKGPVKKRKKNLQLYFTSAGLVTYWYCDVFIRRTIQFVSYLQKLANRNAPVV